MKALVNKWGNSAAVRIPSAVMAAARLRLNQPVNIREEEGRIIIEPLRSQKYDLDTLLAGVTDDNIHQETDMGPPVGKEIW